ncbi:MAG: hypothetical protein J2P47_01305 [Acetobacteraceae bacterium]|nr:hypothetical protein [Acetobacteraceae bacterium]
MNVGANIVDDAGKRRARPDALPILNHFIARMGLAEELRLASKNPDHADALPALVNHLGEEAPGNASRPQ